jgi:hypothetical protein
LIGLVRDWLAYRARTYAAPGRAARRQATPRPPERAGAAVRTDIPQQHGDGHLLALRRGGAAADRRGARPAVGGADLGIRLSRQK